MECMGDVPSSAQDRLQDSTSSTPVHRSLPQAWGLDQNHEEGGGRPFQKIDPGRKPTPITSSIGQ